MNATLNEPRRPALLTEPHRLGMLLFIGSEAAFFAILISSYIYFQAGFTAGPNATNSLNRGLTGIYTIFLLASSVTMWLAGRSLERDRQRTGSLWLVATVVLGGIFLFGQVREYIALYSEDITISRNIFGSTFFTLTGFHGLHVFGGLVAIAILTGLAFAGDFRGGHANAVEVVSLYWHFVDVVWIVLFSLIYLWPLVA
jgi:heme/copper-type cytochrome/quinol oxidase subunit 3